MIGSHGVIPILCSHRSKRMHWFFLERTRGVGTRIKRERDGNMYVVGVTDKVVTASQVISK